MLSLSRPYNLVCSSVLFCSGNKRDIRANNSHEIHGLFVLASNPSSEERVP